MYKVVWLRHARAGHPIWKYSSRIRAQLALKNGGRRCPHWDERCAREEHEAETSRWSRRARSVGWQRRKQDQAQGPRRDGLNWSWVATPAMEDWPRACWKFRSGEEEKEKNKQMDPICQCVIPLLMLSDQTENEPVLSLLTRQKLEWSLLCPVAEITDRNISLYLDSQTNAT
jgi:hypothetical protein